MQVAKAFSPLTVVDIEHSNLVANLEEGQQVELGRHRPVEEMLYSL
jgi:hypothetical protein